MVISIQRDTRKKKREYTEGESRNSGGAPRHCRACRDVAGKTRAQLELKIKKDVEDHNNSSFKYILQ